MGAVGVRDRLDHLDGAGESTSTDKRHQLGGAAGAALGYDILHTRALGLAVETRGLVLVLPSVRAAHEDGWYYGTNFWLALGVGGSFRLPI